VLERGPGETIKCWGEWLSPANERRQHANDAAALIACRQRRLVTEGYSGLEKIAVPTLLYAGSADLIHDAARQAAAKIPGAKFISLPGLTHIAVFCQPQLILPRVEELLEIVSSSSKVA
jgi:pimeloyl-ACP methyl ester carboxylesterase